jgi:hypothetical protein
MKAVTILTLGVAGLFLGACANPLTVAGFKLENNKQTGIIELKVSAGGNRLTIENNPNTRCNAITNKQKFKRGCFDVAVNDSGEFTFQFKQSQDKDNYYMAGFQICQWGGNVPEAPDRGTCGLTIDQRRDFSIAVNEILAFPDEHGVIDFTQFNEELDSFVVVDVNTVDETYFYWVDVCPDGEVLGHVDCLAVDPGSRNGGRD